MKIRTLLTTTVACTVLMIPVANAATILGTGDSALLNGDLTDPENDGVGSPVSGSNFNWISITANKEASFDDNTGAHDPHQASFDIFDNSVDDGNHGKYCCAGAGWNVTVEFGQSFVLTHFTAASSNDSPGRDPDVWQILGSNDGSSWTNVFSFDENDATAPGNRSYAGNTPWTARNQVIRWDGAGDDFATPAAYSHFRLNVDSASGWNGAGGELALAELELFGTAIPEPSSFALVGLAGLGLVLRRRR